MKKSLVIALAVTGLAGGCATSEPDRLDAKFGTSVQQSLVQQTYNPNASQDNATRTPDSLDGQKASTTLQNYRTAKPTAAESRAVRDFDFGD
jgi:hypothetical protein